MYQNSVLRLETGHLVLILEVIMLVHCESELYKNYCTLQDIFCMSCCAAWFLLYFAKKEGLTKCYVWSTSMYDPENCTIRKIDQKYFGSFHLWGRKRLEKIISADRVKNEVLRRAKKRKKANWIGHALHRNCSLKQLTEWHIAVNGRQGRRSKQLLVDLKEK
jgi:hypothetical protein